MLNDSYIDMVVDLQFGSTGKGLVCGYLGNSGEYDVAISINGPNAGHTFVDADGNKFVFKILPTAACSNYISRILIGPGAVFDWEQLMGERNVLREHGFPSAYRIMIHENAWVLPPGGYREVEKNVVENIGSTGAGMGAAQMARIARGDGWEVRTAIEARRRAPKAEGIFIVKQRDWRTLLGSMKRGLLEGSQGFGLSIHGGFYPYSTSRDCTPGRFLSDAMVPHSQLARVYGVMRTLPIRVGGNSGGWYPGQRETSWNALDLEEEWTTVTNRVRRVAEFSMEQIEEAVYHCRPCSTFLTHCDQVREGRTCDIIEWYDTKYKGQSRVSHTTWGPSINNVVTETHDDDEIPF